MGDESFCCCHAEIRLNITVPSSLSRTKATDVTVIVNIDETGLPLSCKARSEFLLRKWEQKPSNHCGLCPCHRILHTTHDKCTAGNQAY